MVKGFRNSLDSSPIALKTNCFFRILNIRAYPSLEVFEFGCFTLDHQVFRKLGQNQGEK